MNIHTRSMPFRPLYKLSVYFFCLAALLIYSCTDHGVKEPRNNRPAWTKKSYWKDDHAFHAVGIHSGRFINERDAYFSALRELAQFVEIYGTSARQDRPEDSTDLELAGIIKCSSEKSEHKGTIEGAPGTTSSSLGTSLWEEFSSEFRERADGVDARYYISAVGGDYSMEMKYECSTKDLDETLKRIPVADTYHEKNDGSVTTYVMIDYSDSHLAEQTKDN